jgi:flagellar biogenesis protein FliO
METAALQGPSYWQVGLAMAAVLGLLIATLKFLQRWQQGTAQDDGVQLVSVRRLGPKRELQTLRVGDQVHTVYRHDGAMVLLQTAAWQPAVAPGQDGVADRAVGLTRTLRTLAAAAGEVAGRSRS